MTPVNHHFYQDQGQSLIDIKNDSRIIVKLKKKKKKKTFEKQQKNSKNLKLYL